jgi:hypothetical protein
VVCTKGETITINGKNDIFQPFEFKCPNNSISSITSYKDNPKEPLTVKGNCFYAGPDKYEPKDEPKDEPKNTNSTKYWVTGLGITSGVLLVILIIVIIRR